MLYSAKLVSFLWFQLDLGNMTNAMRVLTLICFLFICFIFVLVFLFGCCVFLRPALLRCVVVFYFYFYFFKVLLCCFVFCFFILNDCDKTALDWMLRPGLIEQKTPLGFRLNSYILFGFVSKVSDFLQVEPPASILAKLKQKSAFMILPNVGQMASRLLWASKQQLYGSKGEKQMVSIPRTISCDTTL